MSDTESIKKKLKVGVSTFFPLVFKKADRYDGFEIELWEKIAKSLALEFSYTEVEFKNILSSLKDKKIDIAMAGISRTAEREKMIDFSHFTLRSGLLTLVSSKSRLGFFSFLKNIIASGGKSVLYVLLLIMFLVFVFAHGIYFLEKGSGTFSPSYGDGIEEAAWWAIVTISTVGYGDFVPQTLAGRIAGVFAIIMGYSIFGLLIANLASLFTLTKIKYRINAREDLKGKKVATKAHTTSVDELQKIGAKVVAVEEIEDAYKLLLKNKVGAVVFDAPAISHFLSGREDEKFISVGKIFAPQTYGFAIQSGSRLREPINREILRMMESGEYDELHKKWFGEI